ncbi:MAG: phosphoribosylglycinamide formyltransferase [Fluviicola sp.]|nr:MAG: phosphoribosylglycinamide formyltransferase [Fluviicola sp.]
MTKQRIGIFASGTGSNALNLIRSFKGHDSLEVGLVLSNVETALVLKGSYDLGTPIFYMSNADVSNGGLLRTFCQEHQLDWIVLAGYLRKIPTELIRAYPNKMINLHPSLLPKFGGKGMYGANVHKAVLEAGETETGITIHFVNEEFDKGQKIAQFFCGLTESDDLRSVQKKISQLEQAFLPTVVETTILK